MILNDLPWKQRDHSVVFETAPKYWQFDLCQVLAILNSSVDYEGYPISSKEFCPQ